MSRKGVASPVNAGRASGNIAGNATTDTSLPPVREVALVSGPLEGFQVSSLHTGPIELLCSEPSSGIIADEDLAVRASLVHSIRQSVNSTVWARLEYFQPQIGCLNLCSFCSQSAGTDIWQLSRRGLRNLFSALKTVLLDVARAEGRVPRLATGVPVADSGPCRGFTMPAGGLVGYGRAEHKPGVVFPYLDNDVFSYEYLDEYVRYMYEDLGAKVRLTTIGFSRHNRRLQVVHDRIARESAHAIDGLRLSWTPYAYGWNRHGNDVPGVDRDEFVADFSNTLRTYRPVVERIGRGKERACVEIRFPPLIKTGENLVREFHVGDFHAISAGPYLLVSLEAGARPEPSRIIELRNRVPVYSGRPVAYALLACQRMAGPDAAPAAARAIIERQPAWDDEGWRAAGDFGLGCPVVGRRVSLFQFSNADGPYFSADPFFKDSGAFEAIQFYPRGPGRTRSGYLDSTRYFLNGLLRHVRGRGSKCGFGPEGAGESDVDAVIAGLEAEAVAAAGYDRDASAHLTNEVLPLVRAYWRALRDAGYPPADFFDSRFTIDTGVIVNQGRAHVFFKEVASRGDVPVTPHEERGYGEVSFNAGRGRVFRIAPTPVASEGTKITVGVRGKRNPASGAGGVSVTELDGWLRQTVRPAVFLGGVEVERISASSLRERLMVPGLVAPAGRELPVG